MYCTKKMIIKALSVILAVMLTFTATPLSGFIGLELPEWLDFSIMSSAAETSGTCGDNLTWVFDDTTGTLTISGTGEMFGGQPWFEFTDIIECVIIEDGVTTIGELAFCYCSNIFSIIIPNSVKIIDDYAFDNCTSLTSVTIPDSVTSIGVGAFSYCDNLYTITIPESVTSIGDYAFHCSGLESIIVDSNNQYYSSDDKGVLFNKDKTNLIQYPKISSQSSYIIPDSVTIIQDNAFYTCNYLDSITIPDSVITIGNDAFYNCTGLAKLIIGNSVISIGDNAFFGCSELTNLIIGNSVTSIGYQAFYGCNHLTNITIPDSVTTIGGGAFGRCSSLTSVTISDSVTTIGTSPFRGCSSLSNISVDIKNQYYSNDEYGVLFNKDKTVLIQYPLGNTRTSYIIPDSVIEINSEAIFDCDNLTNLTIGNNVTIIGGYGICNCDYLTSIIIPISVTTIKVSGVYCKNLTDIYYCGTEEQFNMIKTEYQSISKDKVRFHHYASEVITYPTCIEKGYTTYTCEICGDSYIDNYTDTTEHEFESVVTESTETQSGYTSYICSVCNQETLIFVDSTNYVEGIIYKSNSVKDILSVLNSDNSNYKIFDANGNELTDDDLVGTKSTINIYDCETNELIDTHTVIVYGDVNGDGLIDNYDSDIIAAVATCKAVIDDELFLMAADTNHDGAVDGFDVIETELQELDMHNIDQKNTAAYLPKDEDDNDSTPSVGTDDPDGDGWWG